MVIEKKAWPDLFEKVLTGEKKFDLRLADFDCQVGDTLVLKEYDPETESYSGREIRKRVSFVIKTKDIPFWLQEDTARLGYIVMSLD